MDTLILIVAAFMFGGILKGATGAGAPILAIPVLAVLYNVPFAVAILIFPNIVTNSLQIFQHHKKIRSKGFAAALGLCGGAGGIVGSIMLASLTSDSLKLLVGAVVLAYVAFRMGRPDWVLSRRVASLWVGPVGFLAGILQGATGISAPISITFLNAMRMDRAEFMPTISIFFVSLASVQLPLLWFYRIMDGEVALLSILACVPMLASMPIGVYLARHISKQTFDRVILFLLTALAVRLLSEVLLDF